MKNGGKEFLNKYPKTRPVLTKELEEIYQTHYKSNRTGQTTASSLSQKMETWLHRQVAKDVLSPQGSSSPTLELGAGTLNQLPYEPHVHPYDIVEPFVHLYKGSPMLKRIRKIYSDISDVPADCRYTRITSVATLEHICNLPEVVARSALLLADNGVFRASVPSEGTILWTLGWKLTTGLEFKLKYGIDYRSLLEYEHVNSADEIEEVLNYFFESVQNKVLGVSKAISFYRYYECRSPKIKLCEDYLQRITN
jgi:hypothetical protein